MKICIISDSHDQIDLFHSALADAKERGAELVLHCGDVVAPYTLKKANQFGLPIHVIHGNNKGDIAVMGKLSQNPDSLINYHGRDASLEINGRMIFMVHFPDYAEALALTGKWDLICCGHNHRCKIESIEHNSSNNNKTTLLVNPGSSSGMDRVQPTYIFGDLETMKFKIVDIPEPDLPPYRRP
ncbi:MAG: metallophosphoesterase family protein [Gammaproteobacteria bacterium]|uniref:Phosphoesterase n=1 Tax=Candidatus Thiopontia autotrophica TaxID=2841688 RepID=A0A8J6TS91_9GAMM|nr:metallophosphoesterase family protein [Candidatus Thiopontia autotrophica]